MDIKALVKVTSRAWSLDILSLMHDGMVGRQSVLLPATGAGRTAFGQSLSHLIDLELLERNPAHGHPLRPEFRLTPRGVEVAGIAGRIKCAVPQRPRQVMLRRTWVVPILAVSREPLQFTSIKRELGAITDRALSQSLEQLQAQHWLQRKVDTASRPPKPFYQAINSGAQISQAVGLVV